LALLALPLSALVATPSASAETPAGGLGVNAQEMFWQLPSQYWATNLSEMRADGVRTVRADAFWDHVEPTWPDATGHHYNWTSTDTIARELAQYGLRWLPIADYSAAWAGSYTLNGQLQEHSAPANSDYFVSYATALVARYGPGGTFWSQNPNLTPQPIEGLEVWNEPDRTWAWLPGPDPVAYARLYEATRHAAHAVDPGLQVIIGGIAPSSTTFLEALYGAVGGAGQIDAVGVHPYATESWQVVTGVSSIRAVMDAHGDVNVPIDVTEFGWSTGGPGVPVTDAQRAQRLYEAVTWLAQSDCNVERILPHTWSSPEADPSNVEDWFGIVAPDGTPHLSANALAQTFQTLDAQATPANAINSGCGRPLSLALTNVAMTARASSAAKRSRARRAKSHRPVARAKRRTRPHRPRRGHHRPSKPAATPKPAPAGAPRPLVVTPAPAGVTVVGPAAAPARTASQTCVQAVVRSGAYAVAGAVVTFKLSVGGRSLASPPPATTDTAGVATACVSVAAGQSALVAASAEDSNFAPVPTAQLAI
jgi:hypothetical protein